MGVFASYAKHGWHVVHGLAACLFALFPVDIHTLTASYSFMPSFTFCADLLANASFHECLLIITNYFLCLPAYHGKIYFYVFLLVKDIYFKYLSACHE
jgi:hypothetical protein